MDISNIVRKEEHAHIPQPQIRINTAPPSAKDIQLLWQVLLKKLLYYGSNPKSLDHTTRTILAFNNKQSADALAFFKETMLIYEETLKKITCIMLISLDIRVIPESFFPALPNVMTLNIDNCKYLTGFPTSISTLQHLDYMQISRCSKLQYLPTFKSSLTHNHVIVYIRPDRRESIEKKFLRQAHILLRVTYEEEGITESKRDPFNRLDSATQALFLSAAQQWICDQTPESKESIPDDSAESL